MTRRVSILRVVYPDDAICARCCETWAFHQQHRPRHKFVAVTSEPQEIYLEPDCTADPLDGPKWSESPFEMCGEDDCPNCGPSSQERRYVLPAPIKAGVEQGEGLDYDVQLFARYTRAKPDMAFLAWKGTEEGLAARQYLEREEAEAWKLAEDMKRFERAHGGGFDYGKIHDSWGRDQYVHSHIGAAFDGFLLGERTTLAAIAQSDTHPQGGDVKQAPFMSGGVGEADAPKLS